MTPSIAEGLPLVAILAAGRASRFGGDKLDAPCAGRPLGCWALDAVVEAGLQPGIIVTPTETPEFARRAEGWTLVSHPRAEAGLASSLACAVRRAQAERASALLVLLADMPLVPGQLLKGLVEARAPAATIHPDGRPGVPALFPARLFERIASLEGDRGAASLLIAEPGTTLLAAEPDWLLDVDTPNELGQADRLLRARAQLPDD